jgi:ribonuclease HI
MKRDVVGFIKDSIDEDKILNPNQYGFKNLMDVFKELDEKLTTAFLDINSPDEIKIYSDGAYNRVIKRGGYGFVIISNDKILNVVGGKIEHETSNRAEMLAALRGLEYIKDNKINNGKKIRLYSDSKYLVEGITRWIKRWIKNGWLTSQKTEVVNKDLWEILYCISKELNVSWEYIEGHNGNEYNELADKTAKESY